MRLINFRYHIQMKSLLERMDAEYIDLQIKHAYRGMDPSEWAKLHEFGIVVSPEEIDYAADGTLEYKGQKIIVYIRDQFINKKYLEKALSKNETSYRFHISDCKTLYEMRRKGKIKRYVVSRKPSGPREVNFLDRDTQELLVKDLKLDVHICKNCLTNLNWNNFADENEYTVKNRIWREFDIAKYFEKYDSHIIQIPQHDENTQPLNVYPRNWDEISDRIRAQRRWICEECNTDLSEDHNYLHAHHIDGLKYNNDSSNLRALCIECHSDYHQKLKYLPEYREYQNSYK